MSLNNNIEEDIAPKIPERVYYNKGNIPLINLLCKGGNRILDIGCGAGDNTTEVRHSCYRYKFL